MDCDESFHKKHTVKEETIKLTTGIVDQTPEIDSVPETDIDKHQQIVREKILLIDTKKALVN